MLFGMGGGLMVIVMTLCTVMLTVAVADPVESVAVAVIVTVDGLGAVAGAV